MNKTEESDFLSLLRTAKKSELEALAKLLMPYISDLELRQPRIWGDKNRVHLDKATIHVNDLLINTRSGHVTIEEDCFFGHRCMLLTGTHDYTKKGMERLKAVPNHGRDIIIKKGAWLGTGVTVLGGVTVGVNSVVAAGSLVTKDVPDNAIVSGIPAKVVKKIDFHNSDDVYSKKKTSEIVLKSEEVKKNEGIENAKLYLKNELSFDSEKKVRAKEIIIQNLLKNVSNEENKRILVLGSKPNSRIFNDVDIVFGANASLHYYKKEVEYVKSKVAVWGVLGTKILDKVLNSGADELVCLGHEPKVFEKKAGVFSRFGNNINYTVLSFFERRHLVEEIVGSKGPNLSDVFFNLSFEKKFNVIYACFNFINENLDSIKGNYDWPLPLRPSAGIFSLLIAIAKFGRSSKYFISGIGVGDRHYYPSSSGGIENKYTDESNQRLAIFGMDSHLEADIEILKKVAKNYDISTTDFELSKVCGLKYLK